MSSHNHNPQQRDTNKMNGITITQRDHGSASFSQVQHTHIKQSSDDMKQKHVSVVQKLKKTITGYPFLQIYLLYHAAFLMTSKAIKEIFFAEGHEQSALFDCMIDMLRADTNTKHDAMKCMIQRHEKRKSERHMDSDF
eukprot:126450_1